MAAVRHSPQAAEPHRGSEVLLEPHLRLGDPGVGPHARHPGMTVESRLAVAFCPSPLKPPAEIETRGPGTHSPIRPTSYFGASESTTVARSAVSSMAEGIRYSRLKGVLYWPAETAKGPL